MISFLQTFLPIVIYILLIILLIVGIILGIRSIQAINKFDSLVDDVNNKVQSLNGFFNILDFVTDKVTTVTEKLTDGFSGFIGKLFFRKNKDEEE